MAETKTIGKGDMIEEITKATSLPKKEVEKVVNGLINVVTESLQNGVEVNITGFGKFSLSKRQARTGRNPQTGKSINIPARLTPIFKIGGTLKKAVTKLA
jgi:DNA-binding protein HU-beta